MTVAPCANCRLRNRYDRAPQSWLGRLWRWHTRFCPGWRAYLRSLPSDARAELSRRYGHR